MQSLYSFSSFFTSVTLFTRLLNRWRSKGDPEEAILQAIYLRRNPSSEQCRPAKMLSLSVLENLKKYHQRGIFIACLRDWERLLISSGGGWIAEKTGS